MKRFNGRVLELGAMMGSYVWLEEKLPEENSGTIAFEVSYLDLVLSKDNVPDQVLQAKRIFLFH